jgi:hypothetical protein
MHSGISAAAIVAVVLNLVFNHFRKGTRPGASVLAAAPDERGVAPEQDAPGTSSAPATRSHSEH